MSCVGTSGGDEKGFRAVIPVPDRANPIYIVFYAIASILPPNTKYADE